MCSSEMQMRKDILKVYNLFRWRTNNEIFFSNCQIAFVSIKGFGHVKTEMCFSEIPPEEGGFKIKPPTS